MESDSFNNLNDLKGKWSMHYGATPKIFELAELLRGRMTEAEKVLWQVLKKNEWQLNFRRQHPISIYIADFYCHKVKLVIELDGGYHENGDVKMNDQFRENKIKDFGITILRFKNEEVVDGIERVLLKIKDTITLIQTKNSNEAKKA